MAEWDWEAVKQAAYEWMAEEGTPAKTLFVPVGTDEIIRAMCGDIYDVDVKEWPVEAPTFGNERPFGPACVDRSVESTIDVMRGEPNTRGLPFPLYSDLLQRDCQFRFMKQREAEMLGRRIYQIADWTLRQLLLWAVVQRVAPSISKNAFRSHWEGFNMGTLTNEDIEYCQALFEAAMPSRRPNQQSVGDLWIVTSMPPDRIIPKKMRSYIKPVFVTSDQDRQTAGRQFGPDDRIFYTQWNPSRLIDAVGRSRVPRVIVPKHQLGPTITCNCLLCERGGFNETSWFDVNEFTVRNPGGRLSMSDPLAQRLVRTPPNQIAADRIANMSPDEYRQYRQYLLMEEQTKMAVAEYMTPEQVRKILDIRP